MSTQNTDIEYPARFTELMQRAEKECVGTSHSASEWSEIMEAIDENWMTDERVMREYDSGRKVGAENMCVKVNRIIMDMAAAAFKDGLDERARSLRGMALDLQKLLNA